MTPKAVDVLVTVTTRVISFLTVRPVTQMLIYRDTEEALELIDSYSRVYFPGVFGFIMVRLNSIPNCTRGLATKVTVSFQLIYWPLYLYILEDESPLDNSKIFGGDQPNS